MDFLQAFFPQKTYIFCSVRRFDISVEGETPVHALQIFKKGVYKIPIRNYWTLPIYSACY